MTTSRRSDPAAGPALAPAEFEWFRAHLHQMAGIALQPLKQAMVAARLAKRLRRLGLPSYAAYRAHLQSCGPMDPEWRAFINALTTNKTDFFREGQHFELLSRLLPSLRRTDGELNIWSAGCSTGEEPYTLSLVLREAMSPGLRYRILASDIDTAVLAAAERGIYREERLVGVPLAQRQRWFLPTRTPEQRRVHPDLQAAISFQRINLTEEPWPIETRFDAIFCRNVIIYFDRPTQQRLFERFARQLRPGGHLFIGHSESLFGITDRFERVEGTVYRLRAGAELAAPPRSTAPAQARILVGETFASAAPAQVSTLLGSCVSACLFDPERRVGGMNHFLLPDGGNPLESSPRYGAHAMQRLVKELTGLGADRGRLVAKVFGAANLMGSPEVSQRNRAFVREYLTQARIPVLAERLGGDRGMEVRFETHTGRAFFRYLARSPEEVLLAS
jgi:chemotaxis protein methyltransferase CheR